MNEQERPEKLKKELNALQARKHLSNLVIRHAVVMVRNAEVVASSEDDDEIENNLEALKKTVLVIALALGMVDVGDKDETEENKTVDSENKDTHTEESDDESHLLGFERSDAGGNERTEETIEGESERDNRESTNNKDDEGPIAH